MAYSGKFIPTNLEKYRGDPTKIVWRSLWERKFMNWCDTNSSVIQWNSEGVVIPYMSPVDGRMHRYFVDFWIKAKDVNGNVIERLIEIKPDSQTKEPKKKKRITQRYLNECKTYSINKAKWKAASIAAKKNGMQFVVMTEYDLGIAKRKNVK